MIARLLLQSTITTAAMGALLFASAGTLHWPSAWVFLATSAVHRTEKRFLSSDRLTSPRPNLARGDRTHAKGEATMFCKPPCPDEHDLSTIPDDSADRSGPKRSQALESHEVFGRLIAPETAGPERRLPPASLRTG